MSLKPVYELETTTMVDDNHTILVYQDNRLKKINAKNLFYTKDDIDNNIVTPKEDIIKSLVNLHVSIPSNATLYDLINYVDKIDLFEIGVRRLVHDGTDTSEFNGEPSSSNNPKFVSMGVPQTNPRLERCYKIGGILTVIPDNGYNDANSDLLYADMSTDNKMNRNDFYGGDYASEKWKDGIYPWNQMERVTDEHGNYFTKVPLYFIKEEFITDTGIDVSESWPTIPKKYINNLIYKYTFVCKTRLPGYRPADFFYDYKTNCMVEDPEGLYVYIQDLNCYTIPLRYIDGETRYSLDMTSSNDSLEEEIFASVKTFNDLPNKYELIPDGIPTYEDGTPLSEDLYEYDPDTHTITLKGDFSENIIFPIVEINVPEGYYTCEYTKVSDGSIIGDGWLNTRNCSAFTNADISRCVYCTSATINKIISNEGIKGDNVNKLTSLGNIHKLLPTWVNSDWSYDIPNSAYDQGVVYHVSDTNTNYMWTGFDWIDINTELFETVETFNDLPGTYKFEVIGPPTDNDGNIIGSFNEDTGEVEFNNFQKILEPGDYFYAHFPVKKTKIKEGWYIDPVIFGIPDTYNDTKTLCAYIISDINDITNGCAQDDISAKLDEQYIETITVAYDNSYYSPTESQTIVINGNSKIYGRMCKITPEEAEIFNDGAGHKCIEQNTVYKVNDTEVVYKWTGSDWEVVDDTTPDAYTKILTRDHYFACYEAAIETVDGVTKIVSKPGLLPTEQTKLSDFRQYCKNTDSSYFIRDIRSYTDFFCTLFEIEFATTDSQSIAYGASGGITYDNNYVVQESAENTNSVIVNCNFDIGTYICIGNNRGSFNIAKNRKVLSSDVISDNNYNIHFDGEPVTITAGNVVWGTRYPSGYCDNIDFRSAYMNTYGSNYGPFKWNWIENPYCNSWKYIDGLYIKHEMDENELLENCVYISNNPHNYGNSVDNYDKLSYIMPSGFMDSSGNVSHASGYIIQMGYDPTYPWCKVTSKVADSSNSNEGYCDMYYENTMSSELDKIKLLIVGGSFMNRQLSGLYMSNISDINLDGASVLVGAAFQKTGK